MMKLDILLVTYNQEKYIRQALDGIILQKVDPDIEVTVIVADDSSTDSTLAVIKEYAKISQYKFVFLPTDKNLGIAANYQRAIAATSGDYVAILEGDDYWIDTYRLQKHIDYMSSHVDCVITKNQYLHYSQRLGEWSVLPRVQSVHTLRGIINHYPLANLSASMYRGDVLRNVDARVFEYGERQRREATDWYMTIDVMKQGYMYIFDEVMSVYRVDTGENISRTDRSTPDEIDKAKLCYELSVDLLGDSFKAECKQIMTRTYEFIIKANQDKKVQIWSEYISPCIAEGMFRAMPKVWWSMRHFFRQLIPNKLYRTCKS